jgi:alkylation response protein AidB-like acyl-CoA dehydrogenase
MTITSPAQQIHALLPQIRGRREEIERARELPRDLVQELQSTGIFRMAVPRALGGLGGDEADPLDAMRAIETVAAADGSTGWCTMLGIGFSTVAGYMPEAGAREVFADPCLPGALVAEPSGAAVPVDGGFRVSGRWKFASGITYATWVVAGCVVIEGGQPRMTPAGMPEVVHVLLPVSDVQLHDTWYVSGLCGTGSHDLSCADVFVPERRVFSLFDPSGYRPEPIYQMPILTLVAPAIAAVALGIARAALDEVSQLAVSKTPTMSMTRLAEKPVTQVEIARSEGALGAARSYLYDTLDDIWETVVAGGQPTMRQRSLCRIASTQAVETASRVAHTASTLAGGTSVYNASSLQRHARDADVITHHVTQSLQVWEDAGRVLMGFDPLFPLF